MGEAKSEQIYISPLQIPSDDKGGKKGWNKHFKRKSFEE